MIWISVHQSQGQIESGITILEDQRNICNCKFAGLWTFYTFATYQELTWGKGLLFWRHMFKYQIMRNQIEESCRRCPTRHINENYNNYLITFTEVRK